MATTTCRVLPAISSIHSSFTTTKLEHPAPPIVCFRPTTRFSRLRISRTTTVAPNYRFRVLAASGQDGKSDANPELGPSFSSSSHADSISDDSDSEARIDIKLPRRSLIVQFTCDACGERTERLINRLAYERGTVFVQAHSDLASVLQGALWFFTSNISEIFGLPSPTGSSFHQCAGCLQHHKLVDNLGLVVEYDLRENITVDSNADQV